ncbi:MAG: ADP-glyceromanno-heptose 6-epimerase [Bacteroidota bacterium]
MIVVTGAAGFIGSNMIATLYGAGYRDLVAVDEFSSAEKMKNLENKAIREFTERTLFEDWIEKNHRFIQLVIHLGARTDTAEFDRSVFDRLNLGYSKMVWNNCVKYGLPLIYASSAATYGMGEQGYEDHHGLVSLLRPLNPYGESKNEFDLWALQQQKKPFFWAGLKFFNVYGPNEYHKGRMASVVYHAYRQISDTGMMKLFRSHHPAYRDGEQLRDFIYVEDVCDVILWLMENRPEPGIYNVGTGKAGTFNELVSSVFTALGKESKIGYIDTPADIRDKYQYFTEARMDKLRNAGYTGAFRPLREGVPTYVKDYLLPGRYR